MCLTSTWEKCAECQQFLHVKLLQSRNDAVIENCVFEIIAFSLSALNFATNDPWLTTIYTLLRRSHTRCRWNQALATYDYLHSNIANRSFRRIHKLWKWMAEKRKQRHCHITLVSSSAHKITAIWKKAIFGDLHGNFNVFCHSANICWPWWHFQWFQPFGFFLIRKYYTISFEDNRSIQYEHTRTHKFNRISLSLDIECKQKRRTKTFAMNRSQPQKILLFIYFMQAAIDGM